LAKKKTVKRKVSPALKPAKRVSIPSKVREEEPKKNKVALISVAVVVLLALAFLLYLSMEKKETDSAAEPAKAAAAVSAPKEKAAEEMMYAVKKGESLWKIAGRADVYNDSFLWPILRDANQDSVENFDNMYEGLSIKVPLNLSEEAKKAARKEAITGKK